MTDVWVPCPNMQQTLETLIGHPMGGEGQRPRLVHRVGLMRDSGGSRPSEELMREKAAKLLRLFLRKNVPLETVVSVSVVDRIVDDGKWQCIAVFVVV